MSIAPTGQVADRPERSKYWLAWLGCGVLLNLAIGYVAALPITWATAVLAAFSQSGFAAFQDGKVGSAALVSGIALAVLIVLFIFANRSIRRLTGLPALAYWPLAIVLALVPVALLLLRLT